MVTVDIREYNGGLVGNEKMRALFNENGNLFFPIYCSFGFPSGVQFAMRMNTIRRR